MAIISEQAFVCDGTQKEFQVVGNILSDSHIGVWLIDYTTNPITETRLATADYDVLGSIVLLDEAPADGLTISLILTDNGEGIEQPPSTLSDISSNIQDINIVADNFESVTTVGNNIDDVISVADNESNINTVATGISNVNIVGNNIDDILAVSGSIEDVSDVADNISSVVSVAGRVSAIDNAVDTITNLSASATSVPAELGASATLVGSNIEIKVPRGSTGADGENGLTPDVEFSYNPLTGNLEYDIVGYLPISQLEAKEV